ncbi:MAG TPA: hypothetical protein VF801_13815 [Rhodocyclaceae bacterium]
MRLTLCLPGLLLPRQALLDTVSDLRLPALMRVLGQGRLHRDIPTAHYVRVMQRWELEELPAAALRLLGEGGAPGSDDWLCLDPVHLSVDRRGVKLDDPAALALTAAEDAELRAAAAPLVAGLGELSATVPGHWYLRLAEDCHLVTRALPEAIGRYVDPALPGGSAGARWRRLLAEAQTVLHHHPVNRAREAAGQVPANHLWAWGEGRIETRFVAPFDALWTRDTVLQGLARASGIAGREPPAAFEAAAGRIAAVVDKLAAPARDLDALAWREALADLERDWIVPALDALRRGRCSSLHIAAFGEDASLDIDVSRLDLMKFWRRPQPLARLAK